MNHPLHQKASQAAGMGNYWAERWLRLMSSNRDLMSDNTRLIEELRTVYLEKRDLEVSLSLLMPPKDVYDRWGEGDVL